MSFPRYPKYKASGVEWLGEVPEHWALKKIKHLARSIEQGWSPQCEGFPAETETEWGVLKVGCVNGGMFNPLENKLLPPELEPNAALAIACGDLLISRANTRELVGSAAVAERDYPNLMLCDKLYRLRFNLDLCCPRFVSRYLRSTAVRGQIELGATGASASMVNIGQSAIMELMIAAPPFDEQRAIAVFLDRETTKIDELVGEQRRLIDLLKEKRQAVISHAVTKGLNPDAPVKPSGIEWLGDVPEHWEVSRIANVFREVIEAGTDDLPILSVSIHHGVSDEEIDEEDMDRKVARSDDRSKYKQVSPGDLVYNMMRAWQGGFGTVNVAGMVSPAYVVARPLRSLETAYIEYLLRTPQAIEQMRRHSRGVTDFRLRLYWDEFKNIRVALPPPPEAKAICAKIAEMEDSFVAMSAACEESISLLQERRTAIISAAVTGQIRRSPPQRKEIRMSLHKEISFETRFASTWPTTAGCMPKATMQATTGRGHFSRQMCWPGCRPRSPKPGKPLRRTTARRPAKCC